MAGAVVWGGAAAGGVACCRSTATQRDSPVPPLARGVEVRRGFLTASAVRFAILGRRLHEVPPTPRSGTRREMGEDHHRLGHVMTMARVIERAGCSDVGPDRSTCS